MIKAQSEWLASNHRTLLGKGPWLMFKLVFPLYTILSSISNDTDLLLYNFQEILYNPSIVWEIVPGFLQYRLAKTSTAAAVASSVARSLLSNGGQKWISVKFVHTVDHLKKNFLKKFLLEHLTPLLFSATSKASPKCFDWRFGLFWGTLTSQSASEEKDTFQSDYFRLSAQ